LVYFGSVFSIKNENLVIFKKKPLLADANSGFFLCVF
jgi:hypothetical protein